MHFLIALTAAAIAAPMSVPALAQGTSEHGTHHDAKSVASAPAALSDGVVRKVDKDAGKLTLKHGPIANLGMPDMTMVFRVKDPAMLERVKAGDKVKFAADSVGGQLTVTRLEPVR